MANDYIKSLELLLKGNSGELDILARVQSTHMTKLALHGNLSRAEAAQIVARTPVEAYLALVSSDAPTEKRFLSR